MKRRDYMGYAGKIGAVLKKYGYELRRANAPIKCPFCGHKHFFVDDKRGIPVARILGNHRGRHLFILVIAGVQGIQFPKPLQLLLVFTAVLADIMLKPFPFVSVVFDNDAIQHV